MHNENQLFFDFSLCPHTLKPENFNKKKLNLKIRKIINTNTHCHCLCLKVEPNLLSINDAPVSC